MVHSACLVTPGSKNRANDHEGSPGNLGDPPVSTEQAGRRYRHTNSRLIHGSATGADGDEQRSHRWYRQAKETKCGEMGGRESQCLIVAMKRGNEPYRTPWSEGGRRVVVTGWNHAEDTELRRRVTAKPPGRVRDSGATT